MLTSQWARAYPEHARSTPSTPATPRPTSTATAGTQTVEEGAEVIVRLATIGPDGPTGTYQDAAGAVPW